MLGFLENLAKGVVILSIGSLVGLGIYKARENFKSKPSYSFFEPAKPYDDIKINKNIEVPLKPNPGPEVKAQAAPGIPVLVLKSENTLVFNGVVTDASVAKFQLEANKMSNKLPVSEDIIMVLYTPGGSVDAEMLLIDTLKALPQKVKTLTIFAASMGFQFVQNMDQRMIIPSGVLMSHRATGGMSGEFGGEFDVRHNATKRQLQYMDQVAANRMGISLVSYRELIRDEYWIHGFEALSDKAADKLVYARCGKEMVGTEEREMETMFGTVKAVFSKCPLIVGPIDVKFDKDFPEGLLEMRTFIELLYQNPREFWKTYIKTEKYSKILYNNKK